MAQPETASPAPNVLADSINMRKIGRVERFLGPEYYRILRGLLTTPASIAGLFLITLFAFIAIAAPLIAPPLPNQNPYKIPRDGFEETLVLTG